MHSNACISKTIREPPIIPDLKSAIKGNDAYKVIKFQEFCSLHNQKQLIKSPTRITENKSSLLDHVITNCSDNWRTVRPRKKNRLFPITRVGKIKFVREAAKFFFCQFLLSNNLAFISGKTQKHIYKDG